MIGSSPYPTTQSRNFLPPFLKFDTFIKNDTKVKEEDLLRELITIEGTKISSAEIAKLVKRLRLKETVSLSQFAILDSKFLHRNLSLLILKINSYLLSNVIKPENISCSKNPPLSAYENSSFTNEFKPNLKDPIFILE